MVLIVHLPVCIKQMLVYIETLFSVCQHHPGMTFCVLLDVQELHTVDIDLGHTAL